MSDLKGYIDANPIVFAVSLLLVALSLAETLSPLRKAVHAINRRWVINTALYLINVGIAAVLVPGEWALGGGVMVSIERALGPLVAGAVGLLALDLAFYVLHRLQHASASLWRLHMVHHSDLDLDVTTAIRHHPGEFLVNCLALGAVTILLGIPPWTVALYGAIAMAVQMIQHANVNWPIWTERVAAVVIVTPALHRRHHSCDRQVSNSNFGVVFSIWDRLFCSFDCRSAVSDFGVGGIGWPRCRTLWAVLALPLGARLSGDGDAAE